MKIGPDALLFHGVEGSTCPAQRCSLTPERPVICLKIYFTNIFFYIFRSRKAKNHSSPKDAGGVSQVDRTPSSSEDIHVGIGNAQSWTHLSNVLVLPVAGVTFLEGFLCNLLSLPFKQHA